MFLAADFQIVLCSCSSLLTLNHNSLLILIMIQNPLSRSTNAWSFPRLHPHNSLFILIMIQIQQSGSTNVGSSPRRHVHNSLFTLIIIKTPETGSTNVGSSPWVAPLLLVHLNHDTDPMEWVHKCSVISQKVTTTNFWPNGSTNVGSSPRLPPL